MILLGSSTQAATVIALPSFGYSPGSPGSLDGLQGCTAIARHVAAGGVSFAYTRLFTQTKAILVVLAINMLSVSY